MRKLILILLLLFAVGFVVLKKGLQLYHRFEKARVSVSVKRRGKGLSLEVKSMDRDGAVWLLVARSVKLEEQKLALEDVKLSFFSPKIKSRLYITGDRGTFDRKKKKGWLKGNVVVRSKAGVLKAKRLVWWQKERKVCVPGYFVFTGRYNVTGRDVCMFLNRDRVVVYHLKRVVLR